MSTAAPRPDKCHGSNTSWTPKEIARTRIALICVVGPEATRSDRGMQLTRRPLGNNGAQHSENYGFCCRQWTRLSVLPRLCLPPQATTPVLQPFASAWHCCIDRQPTGNSPTQTTCPRGIPFSVSLVSPVPSLLRRVRVEIQDAAKLRRGTGLGAHNRGADPRENIRMVDGLALGTLQSLQGPGRRLLSRWSRAVSGKGDAGREIQVRLLAVTPMPTSRHERAFPTIGRQSQPAASDLSTICSMH